MSATQTGAETMAARSTFDVQNVRADFPALHQDVHGKRLVYLDNAASAQTPQCVIDAITSYYTRDRANVHRGVHLLSQRATMRFDETRERTRAFLNAESSREIVFTRGTTESLNLVAHGLGARLQSGDEILLTGLEHHSNIVPWQLLAEKSGATIRVAPINDAGEVPLEDFAAQLTSRTRIAAFAHVSNALGTVNPVREMVRLAQAVGALTVVDGAQAVCHRRIDVQSLDCDFYAFSGHKLFGPTGVGVLYGRASLLDAMPPWQGGGDMIRSVRFAKTEYADAPMRFEAGTPSIADVIGLGAALEYLGALDWTAAATHEQALLAYVTEKAAEIPGLRCIGTAQDKEAVFSFVLDDVHPHDVGTILDMEGIAIRTGHHCAQPVMERFGLPATARASFAFYNTFEEVDALVQGLHRCIAMLR